MRLGWLLDNPFVIKFLLGLIKVVLCKTDIIVYAEVGDWVVNVVATLWCCERGLHGVLKTSLSFSQVFLSCRDISVSSIVGNNVVDIPVRLLP